MPWEENFIIILERGKKKALFLTFWFGNSIYEFISIS